MWRNFKLMLGASMNNTQFANLQTTFVQLKRLRQHIEEIISSNHVGKAIAVINGVRMIDF